MKPNKKWIPNRKFGAPYGSNAGSASPVSWSRYRGSIGEDTLLGKTITSYEELTAIEKLRRRQFPRRNQVRTIKGEEYRLIMVTDPKLAINLFPDYQTTRLNEKRAKLSSIKKRREITKQSAEHLRKQNYNARVIHWKNQSGIYIKVGKKKPPYMSQLLEGKDVGNKPHIQRKTRHALLDITETGTRYRRANLVERPVTFNYTIKDKGSNTKAYNFTEKTRPPMLVIGEEKIPMDQANDYSSSYKPYGFDDLKAD